MCKATNQEFSVFSSKFEKACGLVRINFDPTFTATKRQASKWRRRKGLAYKKYGRMAEKVLSQLIQKARN